MKIGYTINLGNYESMRVDSSESETWKDALAEVVDFLRRVRDDNVQKFVRELLELRITEDEEEKPPTEGEQ